MSIKHDQDKPDIQLVLGDFSKALVEVCRVGTMGAKKYSPHGWLSVSNGLERYKSAMLRHWSSDASGELTDEESGLLHASHMAWNALAVLQLQILELEKKSTQQE